MKQLCLKLNEGGCMKRIIVGLAILSAFSLSLAEANVIFTIGPVSDPTIMLLLGSGMIALAGYGRKKFFGK